MHIKSVEDTNRKKVISNIAETYKQLYINPDDPEAKDKYNCIVRMGEDPGSITLDHFIGSYMDTDEYMDTPAGRVRIITLYERSDFVTFLKIMAHRCEPAKIPSTQGASLLDGVINWRRIDAHKEDFMKNSLKTENITPDWNSEFKRFTADKSNYLDALIVLSSGPYSNVKASMVRLDDTTWLSYSHTIRLYHECTHFICRRLYPDKIDAVWDELLADAVGIYAALGHFDIDMEALFLGITKDGYSHGRLENYVDRDGYACENEYLESLNELARKTYQTLLRIETVFETHPHKTPFEFVSVFEESKDQL